MKNLKVRLLLFAVAVLATVTVTYSAAMSAGLCQKFQGDGYTVEVCLNAPTDETPAPTPTTDIVPSTPTAVQTKIPTPTPMPTEDGSGQQTIDGIWISRSEIEDIPEDGAAWADVLANAGKTCTPDLSNQDDSCNMTVLAKAYAYAATSEAKYLGQVVDALRVVTTGNTESGGRTLALGRELAAYVIAADIVGLKDADPSLDVIFRAKLRDLLTKTLDGKTLTSCHEVRPNNWGTMCGGSRAAVAVYLGDKALLDRVALVFQGYLGDRSKYSGFDYGDLSWQCDSQAPVGVNPVECIKSGFDIDGALPEEMRRGGGFKNPPAQTGYAWEGLQGAVVQAEILHRAGYPAWSWGDSSLCRAVSFLYRIGWKPSGDDPWQIALVNRRCQVKFSVSGLGSPGKIMGFTFWTHGGAPVGDALSSPAPEGDSAREQRIVADSDHLSILQEIEALKEFGWKPSGGVQITTDAEGKNLYLQIMEK